MTDSATTGPVHPVLIVNPVSGGGKAQRYDLVGRCRARDRAGCNEGWRRPGVAGRRRSVFGRRRHRHGRRRRFPSDRGRRRLEARHPIRLHTGRHTQPLRSGHRRGRDDVVGALDAFHHGSERRIDLAQVNGRGFVNNASIGLDGKVVQSPEYREAKLRTVIEMLPDLVGPCVAPFDLRFSDPDGGNTRALSSSWCPTIATSSTRWSQGTRGTMDGGTLGVVVVPDGPPLRRLQEWTIARFEIDSGAAVDVGLDGEALQLEPPLRFESLPGALRIRTPAVRRHPGPPPLRRNAFFIAISGAISSRTRFVTLMAWDSPERSRMFRDRLAGLRFALEYPCGRSTSVPAREGPEDLQVHLRLHVATNIVVTYTSDRRTNSGD